MKIKIEIAIAMLIGILLGVLICIGDDRVSPAQAQQFEQTPAHDQFLRAQDRQARALESIASSLNNLERKTR